MRIEDLVEEALKINKDASISEAVHKMNEHDTHDAFVFDCDEFYGILLARDILKKSIVNPDEVKVEKFVRGIKPVANEAGIDDIIKIMGAGEYSVAPIIVNEEVKRITKLSLLKALNADKLKAMKARDVMIKPYVLDINDSVASARAVLRELNITRLPVIENDRIAGIVDILDILLASLGERKRAKIGEMSGEKIELDEIPVKSFVRYEYMVVDADNAVSDVVKKMIEGNYGMALVKNNDKLAGIITTRDILKLVGENIRNYYVSISGLNIEDEIERDMIMKKVNNSLEKIDKKTGVRYLFVHVESHEKGAVKTRYTVSARLVTDNGAFYASYEDWEIVRTFKEVMDRLEREAIERVEKLSDMHRFKFTGM